MIDLQRELQELRKRVARIESALNIPPLQQTPPPQNQSTVQTVPQPSPPVQHTALPQQPQRTWQAPIRQADEKKGGGFLGAIAVICFVLAAIYLIQLAISSGWLNPVRQLAIVFLAGFGLVGSSLWLREKDSDYAGYLASAGVVVLYLASYGGNLYFNLIEPIVSLILVGVIGLYNIYLFKKFDSNFFLVTGAAGVYLGPVLLGHFDQNYELVCGYNLIWSVVFCLISIRIESRTLSALAAYFAFGSIGLMSLGLQAEPFVPTFLVAQTAQFFIFGYAVVAHTVRYKRPLSESEATVYFPVLLIFYCSEYFLLNKVAPVAAPWISMAFSFCLVLLSLKARRSIEAETLPSSQLVMGFAALCFFHSFYLQILTDDARVFLVPVILLLAITGSAKKAQNSSWLFPKIALLLILVIEGQKVFWRMLGTPDVSTLIVAVVSAVMLLAWPIMQGAERHSKNSDVWYLPLAAGHILAIQSLYQITHTVGSLAVSIAWGLYALAVLMFGFKIRDKSFARSATIILLFTTAKVFIYDLSASTAIVRILSLVVTGAVLYLSGFLFRRISEIKEA